MKNRIKRERKYGKKQSGPVLVVMAAGLGSRFKGLKQIQQLTMQIISSWTMQYMMRLSVDFQR